MVYPLVFGVGPDDFAFGPGGLGGNATPLLGGNETPRKGSNPNNGGVAGALGTMGTLGKATGC